MATKRKREEAEAAGEASAEAIVGSLYQDVVDEVDRKVHLSDVSTFSSHRMSTGLACLDLVFGGGIVPGMYTFAGQEQSCKTTTMLTILGASLRKRVPLLQFWDAEGCLVESTTYLSRGKAVPLRELFDLSSVNLSLGPRWVGMFQLIDTHSNSGKFLERPAQLYYGGKKETTKVTLEDGTTLEGARHPVFVLSEDGSVVEKMIEDLSPGDTLLFKKTP